MYHIPFISSQIFLISWYIFCYTSSTDEASKQEKPEKAEKPEVNGTNYDEEEEMLQKWQKLRVKRVPPPVSCTKGERGIEGIWNSNDKRKIPVPSKPIPNGIEPQQQQPPPQPIPISPPPDDGDFL